MKVTVTGGAGFVGSNLCRRLTADGVKVTVIDDLSTGTLGNLEGVSLDLVEGSILSGETLNDAVHDADAIVHLAAVPSVPRSINDPVTSHEANATGTLMVLEAARARNAHVVVASSSSVYGANPALPKAESLRPMPVSPYAVSKLATEAYAISYQRCYALPTLAFRFFNIFGPMQAPGHAYAAVVPAFLHAALTGQALPVHGDGLQTRDFTYVATVVDTILDALYRRVTSLEPVNLAFGTRYSLLDVVDRLEERMGRTLAKQHMPPRAGDVRDSQAECSSVRALFPTIEPTSLSAGLDATLTWMREHLGVPDMRSAQEIHTVTRGSEGS